MFVKDITIINKWFNKTTKANEYVLHTIKGFWSSSNGISINNTQLISSNSVVVRILKSESGYATPNEFKTNKTKWTLKNDDYIVKGSLTSITSIDDVIKNNECMKITNVSVKDYGSTDMQHFEITGE